jgi:hypothetical protein
MKAPGRAQQSMAPLMPSVQPAEPHPGFEIIQNKK